MKLGALTLELVLLAARDAVDTALRARRSGCRGALVAQLRRRARLAVAEVVDDGVRAELLARLARAGPPRGPPGEVSRARRGRRSRGP